MLCAVLVWVLGVSFYLLSFYLPLLDNPELQANIILALGIVPSASLGTYLFYKKSHLNPKVLALTFVFTAAVLDSLITVPVFIIPFGGSYAAFFGNPMFYIIAAELFFFVSLFGNYLNNKKNLKSIRLS